MNCLKVRENVHGSNKTKQTTLSLRSCSLYHVIWTFSVTQCWKRKICVCILFTNRINWTYIWLLWFTWKNQYWFNKDNKFLCRVQWELKGRTQTRDFQQLKNSFITDLVLWGGTGQAEREEKGQNDMLVDKELNKKYNTNQNCGWWWTDSLEMSCGELFILQQLQPVERLSHCWIKILQFYQKIVIFYINVCTKDFSVICGSLEPFLVFI